MKDAKNSTEFFDMLLELRIRIKKPFALAFKVTSMGYFSAYLVNVEAQNPKPTIGIVPSTKLINLLQRYNISRIAATIESFGLLEPETPNLL